MHHVHQLCNSSATIFSGSGGQKAIDLEIFYSVDKEAVTTKYVTWIQCTSRNNRLPREVGDAPFLGTFQIRLDGALSNLIQLKMSLLMAGGWTRWPLKVLCNPNNYVSLFYMLSRQMCLISHHQLFRLEPVPSSMRASTGHICMESYHTWDGPATPCCDHAQAPSMPSSAYLLSRACRGTARRETQTIYYSYVWCSKLISVIILIFRQHINCKKSVTRIDTQAILSQLCHRPETQLPMVN